MCPLLGGSTVYTYRIAGIFHREPIFVFFAVSQHPRKFNPQIVRTCFRAHAYVLPEDCIAWSLLSISVSTEHGHTRVSPAGTCTCTYIRSYVHTVHVYTYIKKSLISVAHAAGRKMNPQIIPAIQSQQSLQKFSSMKKKETLYGMNFMYHQTHIMYMYMYMYLVYMYMYMYQWVLPSSQLVQAHS